jgi:hypothetical protein
VPDAFFLPLGDGRYASQEHTRGPWSRDHQHAGPPAALLGGALQAVLGDGIVARVTVEVLRPVPIAELTVRAEVVRPGRSVQLAEGSLDDDDGPVLLARAWSIRTEALDLPADRPDAGVDPARPVPPDQASPEPFFAVPWDVGYHTAMEVRFVRGGFTEPGPAFAWMRPRLPIVAGEEVTPLQRVLVGADSGNGLSASLPLDGWLFINTDLTVHLHREPAGTWVAFDAATTLEPHGVGLATTVILDEDGPIGRGLQSLLVAHT